ncbi:hypothetical protein BK764_00200 [Bacillus thuringiensis serovar israelensis]|uniref:Uncharacterized protein n=2 Tax=Bacillus thuringiensis TaxID=1428 RepID=A0A242VXT5_BACTU|nr:hypothetical protein [Bacillus anthracis]OTW44011.1 hypothetical protein BK699_33480 [Bacillus thuringiensis serovar mexicanensis]OTW73615.1 hypothetical protein BK707_02025 [Bacillus thuringiensis serovar coreanensis]OTX01624.1 hypothetical protein BK705_18580 [Bacillus thuringiensis serovar monterrey]OTX51252.1 hypothetical protein BK724_04975 [Bacillus thuringiensis serovar sooncheon]OTZ62445.1 hypothetical protein BK764_00200 [Bacillus thuringiensis serovar israelensis]
MRFYKNDLVMVINHPKLQGLGKVTEASDEIALVWVYLYADNNEEFIHIDFLKHATEDEIRAASKS